MILGISGYISFVNDFIVEINKSYVNLLIDVTLLFLTISCIRNTTEKIEFIRPLLLFTIFLCIVYIFNRDKVNLFLTLNGAREFFPFFFFPIVYKIFFSSNLATIFKAKFDRFLLIFLSIQIPVSMYQFAYYGAGDWVGGTLGFGFSGVLSFIIYLSTYYFMTQNFDKNNFAKSLAKKWYLFLFWIPTLINETKVSFLLVIFFFLFLFELHYKSFFTKKFIWIAVLIVCGGYVFDLVYSRATGYSFTEFFSEEFIQWYLAGDVTKNNILYGVDIPRLTKIIFSFFMFDNYSLFIGHGIGHFKGGTELSLTPFAEQYAWLLLGSRPMFFFLLIQIGIIGAGVFYYYWFVLVRLVWGMGTFAFTKNTMLFCTLCFMVIQIYNDSFRSVFFCSIFMYIALVPLYRVRL